MYHVLVFRQGVKYTLDGAKLPIGGDADDGDGEVEFSSLDELVLFLTGHNLMLGDDEVQLSNTCPRTYSSAILSSNGQWVRVLYNERSINTASQKISLKVQV